MTQDGFTAAERIAATLDTLADALLGERATHYPSTALAAFGSTVHPSAGALFGVRIGPNGPGLTGVHGLGTVVEAAHTRRPEPAAGAAAELLARYGGGTVRGTAAPSARAFQLPVTPQSADEKLRPAFPPALAALAADRQVREPDELSTGSGVEARLLVPSAFHPLAIRGGAAALGTHLTEVTEELFAGAGADLRKEWAVVAAALAEETAAAGVVFAGLAAVSVAGRRTHASLVAALTPHAQEVGELANALADDRPAAEVWRVLLPAGPAVLLVEPRAASVPAPLAPGGQSQLLVSAVAQAFVPLPDGRSVLTVQLSTTRTEDWELYAGAFARVLESIQLAWDGVVDTSPLPAARPQAQPQAEPQAQAWPPAPAQQPAEPAPAAPPVPPAPPVAPPVPVAAPPVAPPAPEAPKGTPVLVPPADFNPFAPPAPPAAAPVQQQPPLKGTPVRVPPADFNPFAPQAPSAPAAAPAPAAPAPAPAAADPFGTTLPSLPADPFGTVTTGSAPAPAAAPAAPVAAPAAAPPGPGKGTPVRVPPPDFNPFAPPAPPAAPAAEAPAERPAPGKGTPVRVPPPDFNPFAPQAPSAPAAAAEPPAPEPPAYSPFG